MRLKYPLSEKPTLRATSVMGFNYNGIKINLLDTPGHQDFAEDTFRTLTAVDSVIIVVDAAKGVEAQTRKLMNVCRMRNTPIIVFVNKMDRQGADFFKVVDQFFTTSFCFSAIERKNR